MKLAYIDSCVYIALFEGIPAYQTVISDSAPPVGVIKR